MKFAEIRGSGLGSVIAENNSTKFYLKVIGTNYDIPVGPGRDVTGVYLNDTKVISNTQMGRGINIVKFDDSMKFVEIQIFDIYGSYEVQLNRMKDYINDTKTGLLAMFTVDAISTGDKINVLMKEWGAGAWCYFLPDVTQRRYSWCGILDAKTKNMVSDAAGGKGNSFPASIDYYLDTMSDLGVTGAGQVITQDPAEYSGTDIYLVKSYHDIKSIAEHFPQIKPGDWMQIRCDMKQNAEATTSKVQGLLTMQLYDENRTWLRGINITKDAGPDWKSFDVKAEIPANAVYLDLGFYHYPSTIKTGTVFIRNVVAQPIAPEVVKKLPARLGRFTAPAKEFREGTLSGSTVVKFTKDEMIEASEMQELVYGEWIKVFEHRMLGSDHLFPDIDSSLYSEIPYLFSNMKGLPDLRLQDGRWRFKIVYDDKYMIWEQSSPVEEDVAAGFKLIETNMTDYSQMGGIRRATAGAADRSRYTGSIIDGNWWYAIGATSIYDTGFPGYKTGVRNVQLYAWKE